MRAVNAVKLCHFVDTIPPQPRAMFDGQVKNPSFRMEQRKVRWDTAIDSVHKEEGLTQRTASALGKSDMRY